MSVSATAPTGDGVPADDAVLFLHTRLDPGAGNVPLVAIVTTRTKKYSKWMKTWNWVCHRVEYACNKHNIYMIV